MEKFRKIVFYILAAGYIVFCPLLLLYSFGFIFKPGGIIKTGLIYLATIPAGSNITVNGNEYKTQTPTAIRDLDPGNYSIQINKKGFHTWNRNLPVEEEKATVLDKIILIPEKWTKEPFLSGASEQMVTFHKNTIFLVNKGPTLGDVVVCDYKTNTSWALLERGSPFENMKTISYFSVKESRALVFTVYDGKNTRLLWVQVEQESTKVKDITRFFSLTPKDIKWEKGNSQVLFAREGNNINKIDVSSGAVYPAILTGVKGFGVYGQRLYFVEETGSICTADLDGKNKDVLMKNRENGENFFKGSKNLEVDIQKETLFAIIDDEGKLIINKIPYEFVNSGVKGIKYDDTKNMFLIWTKQKIGLLVLSTEKTGDVLFEKEPEIIWIYEKGENIEQCYWVYQGSHVLFKDKTSVYLMELEGYQSFSISKVIDVHSKSDMVYSEGTGNIYFIDAGTAELMYVDILPGTGVLPEYLKEINKQKKRNKIEELWNTTLPETD